MKTFILSFWRSPLNDNEIGPQLEEVFLEIKTKKDCIIAAKRIALQNDWRFVQLKEKK